jgi:P27 family predicted phage terminase small subunit
MTRGRKPKPSALKDMAGNPGKRALNKKEPKPAAGVPVCPKHLKETEERSEWKRLIAELSSMKLLSKVDRAELALCCSAWGMYVKACGKITEEGEVIISEKGGLYQNPWVAIRNRSMEQIHKFYTEFGLTPSSRARVKVDTPSDEEELEKMLTGHWVGKGAG